MQEFSALDGAILIDKPAGPTSHDVVDAIRRRFQIKKVGHCGTLDPNATGLLIIVLGRGTKLSEKLMGDDKVYEGAIKFGETTDSYDCDGELTASLPVPPMTLDQLNEEAAKFVGDLMQIPPMVSAIKIKGRAALQTGAQRHRNRARAAAGSHLQFPVHQLRAAAWRVQNRLHQGHLRPQHRARSRPETRLRRASGDIAPQCFRQV